MMPTRKQTREHDRRDRIANERRQRKKLSPKKNNYEKEWLAADYEPPPF